MDAYDKAQEFIAREQSHPDAAIMATLIHALRNEGPFDLGALYRLTLDQFELALQVLEDWRLQRYYRGTATAAAAQLPH
jgi:hypothetical protein